MINDIRFFYTVPPVMKTNEGERYYIIILLYYFLIRGLLRVD